MKETFYKRKARKPPGEEIGLAKENVQDGEKAPVESKKEVFTCIDFLQIMRKNQGDSTNFCYLIPRNDSYDLIIVDYEQL